MKEMTKDEFLKEYCPATGAQVEELIAKFHPEYLVAYEVLDMCSSHLGENKVLAVGPNNTVKTLADAEKNKLDMELCSTIKWPVAYCKV
jgi:hypothetical protein